MRERRLAKLFVRYRERGDVDALTAVFDATAPALHGLARHLVRRGGDAEDVLQATFLAAIEHAEGYDAAQPLEPWLTGILVRKARQANERAARRPEPERVPAPVAVDPREQASLAEFDEALRVALAAMPERYRRVLQPFLRGNEKPQEIARRHSIAPGTVRVQIHRGLEMLRRALPAGYALGGMAAVLSSPQWSRIRSEVARVARAHAGPGATGATGATGAAGATGGLAGATAPVGPIAAVATLAALVGTGAWWLSAEPGPTAGPAAVAEGAVATPLERRSSAASAAARTASTDEEPAVRTPDAVEPVEQVSRWVLVADVRGLDPAPPHGLSIRASWGGRGRDDEVSQVVELQADGPLEVALEDFLPAKGAPGARIHLTLAAGEYAALDRRSERWFVDDEGRGVFVADLELERARSRISGRIDRDEGLDLTGAYVGFYPVDVDGRPSEEPGTTVPCEPDGTFSFTVAPERGFVAGIVPGKSPWGRALDLARPRHVSLGTIAPRRDASISGIAYHDGRPLDAPGQVVARHAATWREGTRVELHEIPLGIVNGDAVVADATVDTDEAGAFVIDGLSPGEYDVFFVPKLPVSGSYNPTEDGLRVRAPVDGLELDSPVRIYTVLVSCDGKPVADASVERVLSGETSISSLTGTDGSLQFFTVLSGPLRIAIEKVGYRTRYLLADLEDFGPEGVLRVELERTSELATLLLELNVSPEPVAPVQVELLRSTVASDARYERQLRAAGGVLDIGEVPPGSYQIWVRPGLPTGFEPGQQDFWLFAKVHAQCRPGEITRALVEPRLGGRLVVHVRGLSSGSAAGLEWRLGRDGHGSGHLSFLFQDEETKQVRSIAAEDIRHDGTYWLAEALAPGRYTLSLRGGAAPLEQAFDVRAGRLTDVHIEG